MVQPPGNALHQLFPRLYLAPHQALYVLVFANRGIIEIVRQKFRGLYRLGLVRQMLKKLNLKPNACAKARSQRLRKRRSIRNIPMRSSPYHAVAAGRAGRRNHGKIATEVPQEPLGIVRVGRIKRRAVCNNIKIDRWVTIRRRPILAVVNIHIGGGPRGMIIPRRSHAHGFFHQSGNPLRGIFTHASPLEPRRANRAS
ncbi:MAG: hypothetical protein IOC64_06495 [Methylobacterium sp.]|nr:hypothetical protein [Methylobacterium sp.]MCA3604992.1 hypothetical protein [Methylobacterium sp.]